MSKKILTNFNRYLESYFKNQPEKKPDYEELLKNYNLKTEEDFKKFASKHLEAAQNCTNSDILKKLLDKTILVCLEKASLVGKINKEVYDNLKDQIQQALNQEVLDEAQYLNALQLFILDILKAHKNIIIEELWTAYFEEQSQTSNMSKVFSQRTSQAFEGFVAQTQADPLKRAGMLMLEAVFTFVDFALYVSNKGTQKLSNDNNESQKENPWYRLQEDRLGVKHAAAPAP